MVKKTKKSAIKKFRKDKNAPKKPLTPYFVFMNENRAEFKKNHPDKKVTEIGKLLGEKWRSLSEKEKTVFVEKSKELKKEYQTKLDKYNKSSDKKQYEKEKNDYAEKMKKKMKKKKRRKVETESESEEEEEEEEAGGSDTEDESSD
ncbi:FACT complex subunit ssrp1 [Bonamia ostreae]|uniref:FACT complex subunit ssrp1 n=1 Tax=Bonamia ostreae TaxID=126728 RepID=A0ABV2ASI9_9EUKA